MQANIEFFCLILLAIGNYLNSFFLLFYQILFTFATPKLLAEFSAVGSALRSGRRGRAFESPNSDYSLLSRWFYAVGSLFSIVYYIRQFIVFVNYYSSIMLSTSIPQLQKCHQGLVTYLFTQIMPRYDAFDRAHQREHALQVVSGSMELAQQHALNLDMALTIAMYHDLGLEFGREFHHIHSGELLVADAYLKEYFTTEQLLTMKEAIEDHRASNNHPPRSIYGKVVAEADRLIDVEITLLRTVQYGLKYYKEMDEMGHYNRFKEHLINKYGPDGYLKLWLNLPRNQQALLNLRKLIANEELLHGHFKRLFQQELNR